MTREDKRQDYGEERLVCFGLLEADVVVMVYTERPKGPHVISLRKAEKHEARYYRQVAKENLGKGQRYGQPGVDGRNAWSASSEAWARSSGYSHEGTNLGSFGC